MKRRYIAYVLMCSFWAVTLRSSEDPAPTTLNEEEKTQAEQLQQIFSETKKTDDYYLQLLGIGIGDLAGLQTTPELEAILKPALDRRIKLTQVIPENLRPDLIEALHRANNLLSEPQTKGLYTNIGHHVFTILESGNPQAITFFKGFSKDIAPRKIIQYFSAFLNPDITNALGYTHDQLLIPPIPEVYESLPLNQQRIYNALGHTAFTELSQKDLKVLEGLIRRTPDITQANIYKQRINQLLCEIAAGKPCEPKKEEKPDTKTPDEKDAPTKETSDKPSEKPPSKPTSIESFKTANQKLQNALHSLNTAKRYLKGIERDERVAIKKRIDNELNDYKTIKTIADDIKRNSEEAHAEHRKFAQWVDKIYSAARSF